MSKEEAKSRLLEWLPYIRNAAAEAKKNGEAMMGILCVYPDKSGKIEAQFEADALLSDIAEVIDAPPQTTEDDIKAEAKKFIDVFGIESHLTSVEPDNGNTVAG
jgi:hypothetical protein